ncbi:response regulator receiver protein [Chlorobaculum parvum NCIB 8327]|uniref:Response regulator receiver protein n=1 Tax=Chlorobaculum parvum (strain DSM 263 / NCIMB 8327) TaxID=517417 RepID=B3QRN1_CHLP8|nr:response regulator [Chlorobaculum parvum]ACF10553.1 response regulator receiver protein [Chlorobaculum parvum NCIB 8327]
MRVLIVENEFAELKNVFEAASLYYFESKLQYDVCGLSQHLKDYIGVTYYDYIFVDIDLSVNSAKDGYGVIFDLIYDYGVSSGNIIVMTGHNKIHEELKIKGLPALQILSKPIDMDEVYYALNGGNEL